MNATISNETHNGGSLHPIVLPSSPKPYFNENGIVIYHADSREILPLLQPSDLCVTDPPFNVGKDYGTWKDNLTDEDYAAFLTEVVGASLLAAKNQAWVLPEKRLGLLYPMLPKAKIVIIERGAVGPKWGNWSNQFNMLAVIGQPKRQTADIWKGIRLKGEGYFFREETYGHPGYTPYPLMAKCVELLAGQSIVDPFCGTGTSLRAAKDRGMTAIGIEIDEKNCEIAARRMSQDVLWRQNAQALPPPTKERGLE